MTGPSRPLNALTLKQVRQAHAILIVYAAYAEMELRMTARSATTAIKTTTAHPMPAVLTAKGPPAAMGWWIQVKNAKEMRLNQVTAAIQSNACGFPIPAWMGYFHRNRKNAIPQPKMASAKEQVLNAAKVAHANPFAAIISEQVLSSAMGSKAVRQDIPVTKTAAHAKRSLSAAMEPSTMGKPAESLGFHAPKAMNV